jgi:DNA-binding winged helix-turn-helix (wHTH) protein
MELGDGMSYEFGLFRLDVAEHTLLRDGHPVQLTPKVFEVLRVLVQHSGHLVEKETLLREVWPDCFIEEANLNWSISVLRKALGETTAGSTFIETVPKRGYRFTAAVKVVGNHLDSMVKPEGPALSSVLIPELAPRNEILRTSRRISGPVVVVGALTLTLLMYGWIRGSQANKPSSSIPLHHQVTFTGKEGSPTLSPDGQLLAYVSTESPERQVMVQKAGGRPISVFSAPEAGLMRWSPDSSELMFFARGGGNHGLFVVPQLGGNPRKIASGGQFVACWSPDGRMIAVARFQVGKISILNSQGQHIKTISLEGVQRWISDLDWSRANGSILFVSDDTRGQPGVWTVQPDGSNQKRIVTRMVRSGQRVGRREETRSTICVASIARLRCIKLP